MKILKEIGGFIVLSGPLFPLLVYFIIAVTATIVATRKGAKRGKKRWGIYTALVFFLIMFGDLPLVLGTFKYECANRAGFTVYKTLEQWQQENPGVAETLSPDKLPEPYFYKTEPAYKGQKSGHHDRYYRYPNGTELRVSYRKNGKVDHTRLKYPGSTSAHWLNERFAWTTRLTLRPFARITEKSELIIDLETDEVLAEFVDFSSHPTPGTKKKDWNPLNPQHLKFWLGHKKCPKGEFPNPKWLVDGDSLASFRKKIMNLSGETQ